MDSADRFAIQDLLAVNATGLDEYNPEKAASVYSDDGVLDFGPDRGGVVEGPNAIAASISRDQAEFRFTHHQLGQIVVQGDRDSASAITYCTAWHERHDGSRGTVWIRYLDELVYGEEGWRIRRRSLNVSGAEGFGDTEWERVPRVAPPDSV